MKEFDITMTATLRPELIEKTLDSFNKYLFKKHIHKARLIINVDLISPSNSLTILQNIKDTILCCQFKEIKVNVNNNPHFARAFIWCMNQVQSKYFFHLEEDWELLCDIDFEHMIDIMKQNKTLAHLRLSQFKSTSNHIKAWQNFAYWNGQFFEYDDKTKFVDGWSGHPSLNRTSFMKKVLNIINPNNNPEKQIKGSCSKEMFDLISDHRFGIYHYQNYTPAIKDLGRNWMIENGYRKAGNKAWFVKWEKVK